jgi:vancomycin permeability regulator SanA
MKKQNHRRYLDYSMSARQTKRKKRTRRRIFLVLAALVLCVGFVGLGLNLAVTQSTKNRILSPAQAEETAIKLGGFDCVLVLGAQVFEDGTPSHMLEDRVLGGIALYKLKTAPVLLMSGDHGQMNYDEVTAMKAYAIAQGVPSANIFKDHAGFSTYESVYRTKEVFGAKKVLIVTQRYHLFRALYIAKALGLDAYGVASDPRAYATQFYCSVRETAARSKDFIWCILQPKPTFLGPKISLLYSGDTTD